MRHAAYLAVDRARAPSAMPVQGRMEGRVDLDETPAALLEYAQRTDYGHAQMFVGMPVGYSLVSLVCLDSCTSYLLYIPSQLEILRLTDVCGSHRFSRSAEAHRFIFHTCKGTKV